MFFFYWTCSFIDLTVVRCTLLFWLAMTPLLEMQLHATGAATHHKSCHLCRAGASFLLACLRKWWWRRRRREWRWEEDGAMSKDDFPIPDISPRVKSLLNALKAPCIHCLSPFCWILFHELQRQHGLWLQTIDSTDALWVYSDTPLKTAFFDSRWERAFDSSTILCSDELSAGLAGIERNASNFGSGAKGEKNGALHGSPGKHGHWVTKCHY